MIEDLLATKFKELSSYLSSLSYRSGVYPEHREDISQTVIMLLLEEDNVKPFLTARDLFGRATNLARNEIGRYFANSLPVSGVGRQAHHYARKYLAQNDFNPDLAYANQTETPQVSLALLRIVSGGTGQTDPELLTDLPNAPLPPVQSSLTAEVENRIRGALRALSDPQFTVVYLHLGFEGSPMTLREVSEALEVEEDAVRMLWRGAKRSMKLSLNGVC